MIAALFRKVRVDVSTNKLQFGLIFVVLTLSAMLLLISILILTSSQDPWERTFEKTNGPHLWVVSTQYNLDYSPITKDPAVVQDSGVIISLAENPLILGDEKQDIFLYSMDQVPPVASPLLAAGRWLNPGAPGEIVLDYSLALFYDFQVGDQVEILGAAGPYKMNVVGFAVTGHWFPFNQVTKDVSPGVGYISQYSLEEIQPDPSHWYSAIGLRLADAEQSKAFGDHILEVFPGKLRSVLDWNYVRDNATLGNILNGMFMGLFSIIGLAAVSMIIFNTIGGQILNQYRNIGILKAVGFRPYQITIIFICEYLLVGLFASVLGIVLGLLIAPYLVNTFAESLNTIPPDIYSPGPIASVLVLIELAVGLTAVIPAWQGGQIETVQAINFGHRLQHQRASWLVKPSTWLRLPPAAVIGVKDVFSNPLRAFLTISSLFLTVLIAITAVGAHATTNTLAKNRAYFYGSSADMKIVRNFVPTSYIEENILSQSEVTDYYKESLIWGLAPGHSDQPIGIRLLSGNYADFDFLIKEGRMIESPGEVVVGYAVLDILNAEVGDTIEIRMDGVPITMTIVGRHIENMNLNKVIITSLETYQDQAKVDLQPQTYYLKLDDYGKASGLRQEWLDETQGLTDIIVITAEPFDSMAQLVALIESIGVILMVVAGVNLMSTSLLGIQERVRDFGILKSLGFTPSQIVWSVLAGAVTIVLIALLFGYTLGMRLITWFISQVGIQIGAGPDFYRIDWNSMIALLFALVIFAVLSSLLPAIRASKLEVAEALRYE